MAKPKEAKKRQKTSEPKTQVEWTEEPQNWMNQMMESNTFPFEMAAKSFEAWQGQVQQMIDSSMLGMRDAYDQWHQNYSVWMNNFQTGSEMMTAAWQNSMKQFEDIYRSLR